MQAHSSSKFSIELFQVVSRNGLKTFTWSSSKVFLGKAEARKKICWRAFRARRIKESQRFFLGIVTGFLSYLHCMSFIHTVVVISSKEFLSEPIFVIVWNAVLCKNTSRSIFHQIPVHHTPPPRADHWIVPRCRDPMLSSVRTRRHASPGSALNLGGGHNGEGGVVLNSIKIPWSCEKNNSSGIVGTGRGHFFFFFT